LGDQIEADIEAARTILSAPPPEPIEP
jgi:hypothetical protein